MIRGDGAPWLQQWTLIFSSNANANVSNNSNAKSPIRALFESQTRERDHARTRGIKQLLAKWDELEAARKQLDDNRELATSRDIEIAAMADDEIPAIWKTSGRF